MSGDIVVVDLENNEKIEFTIDEAEKIYNLAVKEKKIVLCSISKKTVNVFVDDAQSGKAIIALFEKERIPVRDENTGIARYRLIVKTDLNNAISMLNKMGFKKEKEEALAQAEK